jgi:L-amino acid N-acyltransferase YncA
MLDFRLASFEELPAIVEIYNSTIAGRMVTADTEPVTVASRARWFNDHNANKRPLWTIYTGNELVGWASLQSFYGRPAYDATAELSIYLHEKHRGKGYGAYIIDYVFNSCERLGIKTLLGYIFAHNLPSIRLFEKKGFKVWGHFPRIATLDGIERDLVILGKRVNE